MTARTSTRRPPDQLVRTFYLDSSALVKRYLAESGSAWVEAFYQAFGSAEETSDNQQADT